MLSDDMIMGIFFLSHSGIGIWGNLLLLVSIYIFLKPKEMIFFHLSVTNNMTIFSNVFPLIVKSFGIKNLLNYTGCKVFEFLYRVSQRLSLCTTCLPSMVQALTISPSKSRWTCLKDRMYMNTMAFLLSFWVINSLIYVRLVPFIYTIKHVVTTKNVSVKMCLAVLHIENTMTFINMSVITIQDLIFLILMSWSRGYIVIFLYRNRKNTEHLHSSNFSSRASELLEPFHSL